MPQVWRARLFCNVDRLAIWGIMTIRETLLHSAPRTYTGISKDVRASKNDIFKKKIGESSNRTSTFALSTKHRYQSQVGRWHSSATWCALSFALMDEPCMASTRTVRVVSPHHSILVLPFQANPKCQIQFDNVRAKIMWPFAPGGHVGILSWIGGDCSTEIFMRSFHAEWHVAIFLPIVMWLFPPECVAAACLLPKMMCPFAPEWLNLFHPEREAATTALRAPDSNFDIKLMPIECSKSAWADHQQAWRKPNSKESEQGLFQSRTISGETSEHQWIMKYEARESGCKIRWTIKCKNTC